MAMDAKTKAVADDATAKLNDEQIVSLLYGLMKHVDATGVILIRDDYERMTFGPPPTVEEVRAADLRWFWVKRSDYWKVELPDRMYEAIVDDLGRWPTA